ncbi:MAG: 2-C-methyl-D-erythritol 4-phosphate cytidylyltransferase [Candidatus Neomarinimicrobiota bacterium]|nr:2-C-methyl-D-erythritol 4-phosphate cytidylyltransferase [Candidatus Neomarinimicrobiota bacterium]
MSVGAIIAAAGAGQRFSNHEGTVRKQFTLLGREPLFIHSLRCILASPFIDKTILVVPADSVENCTELVESEFDGGDFEVIAGGVVRQESVCNAFEAIRESIEVVTIHDAARPFLKPSWIEETIEAVKEYDGAIVAFRATDTLKSFRNGVIDSTIDRAVIWQAQTPQTFKVDILSAAFEKAKRNGVTCTDEAQLVENVGGKVTIVEGSPFNLKVTTKRDLDLAEAILSMDAHD